MKSLAWWDAISPMGRFQNNPWDPATCKSSKPPDVYLPFQLDPNSTERGHYFNVAGRLKPGVSLAAANEQLQASYREYARMWPDDHPTPGPASVCSLCRTPSSERVRHSLLILLAAVTSFS